VADDVWNPSGSSAPQADVLPNVMDLTSKIVAEVQKDFASFLLAGVGPLIAGFVIGPVAVVLVYGGMFLGMVPGMIMEDEAILGLGSMVGLFGSLFLLIAVLTCVTAPMGASTYRAVWKYLTTGEKLTIMAPFSTFTQDLPRVVLYSFLHGTLMFVGLLFCYFPALLVGAMLVFAGPAIYIHRLGIGQAISLSIAHVQQNASWHVGFYGIHFVMYLVLSYIPLLGPMMLATIVPLYVLMVYRHSFGEGETPRGHEEMV
jgi:hypothetical protein